MVLYVSKAMPTAYTLAPRYMRTFNVDEFIWREQVFEAISVSATFGCTGISIINFKWVLHVILYELLNLSVYSIAIAHRRQYIYTFENQMFALHLQVKTKPKKFTVSRNKWNNHIKIVYFKIDKVISTASNRLHLQC